MRLGLQGFQHPGWDGSVPCWRSSPRLCSFLYHSQVTLKCPFYKGVGTSISPGLLAPLRLDTEGDFLPVEFVQVALCLLA